MTIRFLKVWTAAWFARKVGPRFESEFLDSLASLYLVALGWNIFPVNHCPATENKIHGALQFQGAYKVRESESSLKTEQNGGREGEKTAKKQERERKERIPGLLGRLYQQSQGLVCPISAFFFFFYPQMSLLMDRFHVANCIFFLFLFKTVKKKYLSNVFRKWW